MPSHNRAKFVISPSSDGKYKWMLTVRGVPVAYSAKTFVSRSHARRSIESTATHMSSRVIVNE